MTVENPPVNTTSGVAEPDSSSGLDLDLLARFATYVLMGSVIALAAIVGGMALYNVAHDNRIYEGVTVAGVDVGGMTRSEAADAVERSYQPYLSQPIILTDTDSETSYSLDPAAAGIALDVDQTVEAAYSYGRQGSIWDRSIDWASAIWNGADTEAVMSYDPSTLQATLSGLGSDIARAPEDAYLSMADDQSPEIVPELEGVGFDVNATIASLDSYLGKQESGGVDLVTMPIPASVTVEDLQAGLDPLQQVVSSPMVLNGVDQSWQIDQSDLRRIISIEPGSGGITIQRQPVADFVQSIADATNHNAVDATITVNSSGQLTAVPSVEGVVVDVDETTNALMNALQGGDHSADLVYSTIAPDISDAQAQAAADQGEAMLEKGVTLNWNDHEVKVERGTLLEALTFKVNSENEQPFTFGFDRSVISSYLSALASSVLKAPVNAEFRLVDGKVEIVTHSSEGEELDLDTTVENVVNAALSGSGTAEVKVNKSQPAVTDAMAPKIDLGDVIAEASTSYGQSSDARRHNIERAVELIDGWLIAPGEQFSYADLLGSVSEETGFVTGFGIVDDGNNGFTTSPVVGGGICQVSTTIFQSAYWSGLEIDERYSHPYWIQTYGEPPRGMKGLDAMVNIEDSGSLDLKFTNTTGNWIAVEVSADGQVVTSRILGVDPGWTVAVDDPVISNVVEPDRSTHYVVSTELDAGQELQVEYAGQGFTAEVHRTVTDADGAVLEDDTLVSDYAPSQNTVLYGEGGDSPEEESSPSPVAAPVTATPED